MSESKLLVEQKSIVVPGELLAEGMDYIPSFGTYREGDFLRAERVGLVQIEGKVIKLIPIRGYYIPKRNDVIVGPIEEVFAMGWRVRITDAYVSMLGVKEATSDFINRGADLTEYFRPGDIVVCKIISGTGQKLIDVSLRGPGLRKLDGGRLFSVNPYKVPRIIGKNGSMISMIKRATGCNIVVGQNGTVWISGAPEAETLAVFTIRKIEREAHQSGLTETIRKFLETETGKKVELIMEPQNEY